MTSCLNCGGLIGEPGIAYGYVGKFCHCPIHPSRVYQNPSDKPLGLPMFSDLQDFDRWQKCRMQLTLPNPCACVGPKNGQPLCPCQMRGVTIKDGRYIRIQDLGPAPDTKGEPHD